MKVAPGQVLSNGRGGSWVVRSVTCAREDPTLFVVELIAEHHHQAGLTHRAFSLTSEELQDFCQRESIPRGACPDAAGSDDPTVASG